ncbi:peptidase S8/S53 domain-containing protein [Halenospora varia]|nr:peptidase S8/S53 domain-containing protein [Halenospora varia]
MASKEENIYDPPRDPDRLIVILKPEAGIRANSQGVTSADPSGDAANLVVGLDGILKQYSAILKPLFGLSEDRIKLQQKAALDQATKTTFKGNADPAAVDEAKRIVGEAHPLSKLPDMSTFYGVEAPQDKLKDLQTSLLAHNQVDAAYFRPVGADPVWAIRAVNPDAADPVTPNFINNRVYLNPAPSGIDAKHAWVFPGGRGAKVRVIDCEQGWRFSHEDLIVNQGGVIFGNVVSSSENHGTAVLGEISGDNNPFGITGITPDVVISASSFSNSESDFQSAAIRKATEKLTAGDVTLLERHNPGPNSTQGGQQGYIPIEWWYDTFVAIREATAKGIVVVEAAGNGWENLDDPVYDKPLTGFPAAWKNPFNMSNPSSEAVIVGAGAPPPGTHGRNNGTDRSRLSFSCWGSRVDVQGWGREVTSTGYGDLQGGGSNDLFYTDTFNGTSSASPIITGVVASIQGVLKARGRRPLTSHEMRLLLRQIGSLQQADTALPAPLTQRIGRRPNLRNLIPAAAKLRCRSADFDGDGKAEILVSSPAGIALLKVSGNGFSTSVNHTNGSWLQGTKNWLLNTADNILGPVADFDGDKVAETLIVSPWGIGILKQTGSVLKPIMMQPNGAWFVGGTTIGSWLLNTSDNNFGVAADFNGDGSDEVIITSPWGLGILKRTGDTMVPLMMAPNGTRFLSTGTDSWFLNTADNDFSQVGDFNGDGRKDIFVSSPWGIGILRLDGNTLRVLTMIPNGTRVGGWLLNTADNRFGPVGDFDGDGKAEILVSSPWGIGVLKFTNVFTNPMLKPNGTRFGGWLLNTYDNSFSIARDFDGSKADSILVTSPWGIGIWKLAGNTMACPMLRPNRTSFAPGGWFLTTTTDWLGSAAKYTRTDRCSVLIESGWGIGVLELSGDTMSAVAMKQNGMVGSWKVDTSEHDMGHGT